MNERVILDVREEPRARGVLALGAVSLWALALALALGPADEFRADAGLTASGRLPWEIGELTFSEALRA